MAGSIVLADYTNQASITALQNILTLIKRITIELVYLDIPMRSCLT